MVCFEITCLLWMFFFFVIFFQNFMSVLAVIKFPVKTFVDHSTTESKGFQEYQLNFTLLRNYDEFWIFTCLWNCLSPIVRLDDNVIRLWKCPSFQPTLSKGKTGYYAVAMFNSSIQDKVLKFVVIQQKRELHLVFLSHFL